MKPASLSPKTFVFLEALIIIPSVISAVGYVMWILLKNPYLYFLISSGGGMQIIGCLFISPFAAGVLAYGYLERFKAEGWSAKLSKLILAYSIIQIGIAVIITAASIFLIK